ncbi:unnamed protein product [Hermetia illucens]|uniref:MADF domain-containing protein n=1 Tax=Hermetia illucens TaxID=343691 RepID=A0A7R8UKP0_HERIL|nr:unnamed protein product [Hermetia illucens]
MIRIAEGEMRYPNASDLYDSPVARNLKPEIIILCRSECKKRWSGMRDHYKREKKEEKGTTGKAAKKDRAQYWQQLQFLDTVEDERTSFTNILAPSNAGTSSETPQQGIGNEYEEDAPIEQTSQHLSPHTSPQLLVS